ncbi:uncharacterized protein LOC130567524 isoform X2 [Triplophysa rosa]|uniref:uncharacterized protein LOC130567524 isoform X2 n=1 Tax=Triplophysa rosa TaxID=992332 RepID=UPI0025462EE0|nr:uncharacterized protein LOC130567524 isoform X2 [Triplophysa rosa]
MTSLQLVDIWRRKHPVKQNYTFHRGNVSSRLDYFFTPEECMWRVTSCDIRALERPDHQPLVLKICNVSTDTPQKNLQIQSHFQLLSHKNHLGIEMTASSSVQESELSEVDIVSAVHSLQVSDTPRPDGIPASFYKENIQVVIPYIKMLYNQILSGTFNCSERRFNESVRSPHDNSQHFFNVDYILIATILARRLEDFLESQSEGRIPKESVTVLITPKTLHTQTVLGYIREELDRQRQSNPNLFQDFRAAENLVGNVEDTSVPCQGCPLTPVLITLALKCYASQLFQDLEKHVFIFKQSVIVCFPPEDQVKVQAIVTYSTDEEYDIVMLHRGNGEPFHLNRVGREPEDWDGEESDESDDILYCFTLPPATCKIMYAVITLKESTELTVIPTNWLNEHKTQCYWPPFRTPEKCLEVIKNKHEPAKGINAWEILNIVCHWEHDTYEQFKEKREADSEQVERPMYAVITLQESNELTVIPTNWLNEQKTQCYWPSFRTPEKCLDVIKNRLEPARGINAWQQLKMVFHGEYAAYRQAKEKREAVSEQMERPSTSLGCFEKQKTINPIHAALTSQSTQTFGVKRKRDDESPDISRQSLLITGNEYWRNRSKCSVFFQTSNTAKKNMNEYDSLLIFIFTYNICTCI